MLRALGYDNEQILEMFFETTSVSIKKNKIELEFVADRFRGELSQFEIKDKKKVLVEKGKRITVRHIKLLKEAKSKKLKFPMNI